jgi:uncharacterized protein YjbI with pentapeptide repeats
MAGAGPRWATVARTARRAMLILAVVTLVSALALVVAVAVLAVIVLKRQGDLPPLAAWVPYALAGGLAALLLLALQWVPRRQVRWLEGRVTPRELAELEDRYRATLARIIGGAFVAVALFVAWQAVAASRETQTIDRFSHAAELLGSDRSAARLAGVYALEGVANASAELRGPALNALQGFLRQRVAEEAASEVSVPAADVVAVVRVLGRSADGTGEGPGLDLSRTNLSGASLVGVRLDKANLSRAHLEGADLTGAHIVGTGGANLRGARLDRAILVSARLDGAFLTEGAVLAQADLRDADLDGAVLNGADLRAANLARTHLAGAELSGAHLEAACLTRANLAGAVLSRAKLAGADLKGAILERVDLRGADLRAALHLTRQQLSTAQLDESTGLPPGLAQPVASGTPSRR